MVNTVPAAAIFCCPHRLIMLFLAVLSLHCVLGLHLNNERRDEVRQNIVGGFGRPYFEIPDGYDSAFGENPFARHLFEKRAAEIGKRERIIMDAMGGNDYLIKRSLGRK